MRIKSQQTFGHPIDTQEYLTILSVARVNHIHPNSLLVCREYLDHSYTLSFSPSIRRKIYPTDLTMSQLPKILIIGGTGAQGIPVVRCKSS